jgi:signal transduction histidine kinase
MEILFCNIPAAILNGDNIKSFMMLGIVVMVFMATWAINRISILRIRRSAEQTRQMSSLMQHTLDISSNYVLRLSIRERHAVNLHGNLLPEEGMSYEESYEYIHPDDRDIYHDFIVRLTKEGGTTDCIFRWDISGKKHLGEWRYMYDRGAVEYVSGTDKMPINLFCTITDETERIMQEKEEDELTDKYRKMFEQSIVGQAFFDKDGHLLTVNRKMREILKFQSEDDPYYFGTSFFDMPTFRELISPRHVDDLYFCTRSVILERGVNCYTEMRVHPIYSDTGELYYITFSIRDVTQERELYLQNKKNDAEILRANEAIQKYETELQYLMDTCNMRFFRISKANQTCYLYKGLGTPESQVSIEELIVHLEGTSFHEGLKNYENYFSVPRADLVHIPPFFHEGNDLQWNYIDSVPYFDEQGNMLGTYGIIRNVTDLIEKQERLKEETARAKDSGRLKSVFMANMTHEIRTPLNSIVGFSDVLPLLSTPEEKEEIIHVIMNNCDMLLRLINDILAISSLDTGGIHIEPRPVDFAHTFNDICESLRERVQEPGVEFIRENPYKVFDTVIDNGRIMQVITNFVTNAVKYTHQGHIKVGYRYENGQLYIYCEDTGAGIPKEAQKKIFERFVKLNDFIQGTGLGLSICKAIADGCNGSIGVISEGKDQGSTFWLRIPCEEQNSIRI